MQYALRRATDSDKRFLYLLHCATMREAIEKTWGWDEAWQRFDFEKRFGQYLVSIIEADGRDAGGLWLDSSPDVIYIADFQVLPALQGRGIGTSVLRGLIAEAATRRVPVELVVLQVNPRARRLYERLGFRVTEERDPFIRMRHHSSADGTVQ
jgi:ribosomal protein S18 acetylase RimI-like enzyme